MKTLLNSSLVLLALFALTASTAHADGYNWTQKITYGHGPFRARVVVVHNSRLCVAASVRTQANRLLRLQPPRLRSRWARRLSSPRQTPIWRSAIECLPRSRAAAHSRSEYRGTLGWHSH